MRALHGQECTHTGRTMGDSSENNPFLRAMVPPRAIIFDIGGVVVGSPLVGINLYEQERGLPPDYINVGITARGRKGAFQVCMRFVCAASWTISTHGNLPERTYRIAM